jgi:hypothetical protein
VAPEWDENKRQWTLSNRHLDFADAIWLELVGAETRIDRRKDYGEMTVRHDRLPAGRALCPVLDHSAEPLTSDLPEKSK